jgi:hypothetical protein
MAIRNLLATESLLVKKNLLGIEVLANENHSVIKSHIVIDHLLEKRNPSEIKNLLVTKNRLEKILVRLTPLSAIANLERLEVLLRKKRLKKDYSEKRQTQNLASVEQILIKNHLAIKKISVKKNLLVTENQVTEKLVIESRLPNVNLRQKLLLKSQQRLEHLDLPIQNQKHQNVNHAFKIITDFA